LKEIYDIIINEDTDRDLNYKMLGDELHDLFTAMDKCDYLPMRHKSIKQCKTGDEIQKLMSL